MTGGWACDIVELDGSVADGGWVDTVGQASSLSVKRRRAPLLHLADCPQATPSRGREDRGYDRLCLDSTVPVTSRRWRSVCATDILADLTF